MSDLVITPSTSVTTIFGLGGSRKICALTVRSPCSVDCTTNSTVFAPSVSSGLSSRSASAFGRSVLR